MSLGKGYSALQQENIFSKCCLFEDLYRKKWMNTHCHMMPCEKYKIIYKQQKFAFSFRMVGSNLIASMELIGNCSEIAVLASKC